MGTETYNFLLNEAGLTDSEIQELLDISTEQCYRSEAEMVDELPW